MKLKGIIDKLVEKFHVVDAYDKLCLTELVYIVLSEPSNKYQEKLGDIVDWANLRQELFGDAFNSTNEHILGLAGYWSNDLESIFISCVLKDDSEVGTVFKEIFSQLDALA